MMSGVASANTSRAPTTSLKSISSASAALACSRASLSATQARTTPGDAVAVGDADPGHAQLQRPADHVGRMGSAAQEANSWSRRPVRRSSCEQPVEIPLRIGLFLVTARGGRPRSAGRAHPRPGNSRGSGRPCRPRRRLPLPPFGGDPLRPFEPLDIMKLAAPAEAVRRAVGNLGHDLDRLRRIEQMQRPERRLAGAGFGPVGDGPARLDRRQARAASAREYGCPAATSRRTRSRPSRVLSRSISAATSASFAAPPSSLSWVTASGSITGTDSRMRSKPKPGSIGSLNPSIRSFISRMTSAGSRVGWLVSTASGRTSPSLRKKQASNRRPPSCRLLQLPRRLGRQFAQHFQRIFGPRDRLGEAPLGEDRRQSECAASIGLAASPSRWRSAVTASPPKRAAMLAIGRLARSPTVLSPARSSPWVASGSSSSAATGSRRIAAASSLAGSA